MTSDLKYGPPFIIYTENNRLTYLLTTAKLNAVGLRWVAELSDYNFTIKYRPGKTNIDADYFSRRPLEINDLIRECTEEFKPQALSSVTGWPLRLEIFEILELSLNFTRALKKPRIVLEF